MNPYFDAFILFVIIINTFCLSLDKHPELDDDVLGVLGVANQVFNLIFAFEVLLKIIGLGIR